MQNILDSTYAAALGISSGIAQSDEIMLLTIAVALLALLIALRSARGIQKGDRRDESSELLRSGLQGKIARIERDLNELRTETLREFALLSQSKTEEAAAVEEVKETSEIKPLAEEQPDLGEEAKAEKQSLSLRLQKTRSSFFDGLKGLFLSKPKLDVQSLDALEELLIGSDLGVKTTGKLLEKLKEGIEKKEELDRARLCSVLKEEITGILSLDVTGSPALSATRVDNRARVVLVVGINGVGKTTSVAKLGASLKAQGAKVLLVAADTFRAAAVEQLLEWGKRVDLEVLSGKSGARPQTVVFDAMQKAADEGFDAVIIDTAGRLHTKSNLMQELEGVSNIIKRFNNAGPDETLLVLDGATGQNALQQAKEFHDAVPLTGVIVTKLDGTPKGGIVVAIKDELGVPIRYIGVGEGAEDLRVFDAHEFADAVLSLNDEQKPEKVSAHAATRKQKRGKDKGANA